MSWHHICNNKKFTNKLELLREYKYSKQAMQFCIPQTYDSYDFSVEPQEPLENLCRQKALEIRATNKSVVIWYSGGCDSHYVLNIFLKNNIKVDEIHMVKSGFTNADYEIEKYAKPFVENLDIKTIVHEPKLDYYENRYVKKQKGLGSANDYWHHFRLNNDFENLQHHDTDRVAHIFGKEKPTLCFVNGKWYVYFLDVDVTPQPNQLNFFCDDPVIHSKQCHMLDNQIQLTKNKSEYNKITQFNENQNFWNKSIGRYKDNNFPVKELNDNCFNNKDAQAIKQAPAYIVDAWQNKNKELVEELGADVFNNGDPAMGTIGIFSKFYGVSEKSVKTVDELFPNGFKLQ